MRLSKVRRVRALVVRPGAVAACALALCAGCASSNGGDKTPLERLVKGSEHVLWDELAHVYSTYCAEVHDKGVWVERTRIEFAREIRQSHYGDFGPLPPGRHTAYLGRPEKGKDGSQDPVPDLSTRMGRGPIVMIYCLGDEVPEGVWQDLEREWQD